MDPVPTLTSVVLKTGALYSVAPVARVPPLVRNDPSSDPKSNENSSSSSEGVYEPAEQVEYVEAPDDEVYVPKRNKKRTVTRPKNERIQKKI